MSNLQGTQEQYVDYCNIPLPAKQKYASFDAPVNQIKYFIYYTLYTSCIFRLQKLYK